MPSGGARTNSGGRRPGAGRKPSTAKTVQRATALKQAEPEIKIVRESVGGKAITAAIILASVDEGGLWRTHLTDPAHGLDALKYLTDKRDGKAPQSLNVNATVNRTPEERQNRLAELVGIATGTAE